VRKRRRQSELPNPKHLRNPVPSRYVAQMHNDEPLTSTEAAEILGVSVATVNRMATDGRLALVHKFPGLRGPNLFERANVLHLRDEMAKAASA
jgi:excisionase family DNA binding protein